MAVGFLLATGAHVILQPAFVGRPNIDFNENPLPEQDEKQTIGPYHVLDSLQATESEEFLLAYDTRLLRRVWVRKFSDNAPAVAAELRNMGRVGRLRWINGRRTPDECWDAYEADCDEATSSRDACCDRRFPDSPRGH